MVPSATPRVGTSYTGATRYQVIHNDAPYPFTVVRAMHRMLERQPSREPIGPCTVAVLVDQEGEQ